MSSLLEIIELMNGEIVLQRADGEGEPLLSINFSDEAKAFIGDAQIDVVKAMIQAGIEATSMLQLKSMEDSYGELESYDQLAELEAVEEFIAEEESETERLAEKKNIANAANDQIKELASAEVNILDESIDNLESPVKDKGLGPVRASDLSSSRILH